MDQIGMEERHSKIDKGSIKRYAVGIPILLGVYLILLLFCIYPHWPIGLIGWLILIFGGVAISLFLEWMGESLFSEKAGLKLSGKKFSFKRIMVTLLVFIALACGLAVLWFLFGSFLRPHFA
jgi:hypothetical protein